MSKLKFRSYDSTECDQLLIFLYIVKVSLFFIHQLFKLFYNIFYQHLIYIVKQLYLYIYMQFNRLRIVYRKKIILKYRYKTVNLLLSWVDQEKIPNINVKNHMIHQILTLQFFGTQKQICFLQDHEKCSIDLTLQIELNWMSLQ